MSGSSTLGTKGLLNLAVQRTLIARYIAFLWATLDEHKLEGPKRAQLLKDIDTFREIDENLIRTDLDYRRQAASFLSRIGAQNAGGAQAGKRPDIDL